MRTILFDKRINVLPLLCSNKGNIQVTEEGKKSATFGIIAKITSHF